MKLRIIYQNKHEYGFLILEALISLSLFTIMIPAIVSLSLSSKKLIQVAINNGPSTNDVIDSIYNGSRNLFTLNQNTYASEFGKNFCEITGEDEALLKIKTSQVNLGTGIIGTSIVAHNGYIYEGANSSTQSKPDFFIIDSTTEDSQKIISTLNTGPGVSAIAIIGEYAFLANESSVSELQIVQIRDRNHPVLISQIKLPLPNASSTAPKAKSIYFNDHYIYLGTAKWDGPELNIIDVSNPSLPIYISGYDTESQVNSIVVDKTRAYVATSGIGQLVVFDISDKMHIQKISEFSPDGSAVLEGHSVVISSSTLYFARNGGGFNSTKNYELFIFNLEIDPDAKSPLFFKDIPGGIYGIIPQIYPKHLIISSGDSSIQFLSDDTSQVTHRVQLTDTPIGLACDDRSLYESLSNQRGFIYESN